jgi:rhamnogalacturonyl hydrolase YesR
MSTAQRRRQISLGVLLWMMPVLGIACVGRVSVAPAESAWATGRSPRELATLVAAQLLVREEFPIDYRFDVQLQALLVVGDAVGESRYLEFVQEVMSRRGMPPGHRRSWETEYFSSLSFDVFARTRDKAYVEPFLVESRKYRAEALRAFDGIISYYRPELSRNDDEPFLRLPTGDVYLKRDWDPILLDQVQEYASRMAKAGCLSADMTFYRETLSQIGLLRAALRDPKTGLWGHARGWFDSGTRIAATKWGRGQAWLLRGLVEALTYLPPDSPEALRATEILKEMAATLVTYQDSTGFWRQVVDRPESYEETSATGLISYYLARAVRQKFLPEQPYRAAAIKSYEALARSKVSADGTVYGGSIGTPPLPSVDDYLGWKRRINDSHAVAAVLLSAAGRILIDGNGSMAVAPCASPD